MTWFLHSEFFASISPIDELSWIDFVFSVRMPTGAPGIGIDFDLCQTQKFQLNPSIGQIIATKNIGKQNLFLHIMSLQ